MSATSTGGPDLRPIPARDQTNAEYLDAAAEHRFVLQRCDECRRFQYPPDVVCVHCQSPRLGWAPLSGRGSVYSFSVVERPFHVGWVDSLPYVVALVELAEQPGLRMVTNLVDVDPGDVVIGMPVEVVFEDRGAVTLPQFRPAGAVS